jgi:hypothetical protein
LRRLSKSVNSGWAYFYQSAGWKRRC